MPLPTLINIGLYVLVAFFIATGLRLGFTRGFSRQTVRFIFVATSFGLSFAAFSAIYPALYSMVEGKTLADVASTYGIILSEDIAKFAVCIKGETAVYLASVPLAIVAFPIGFILMFASVTAVLTFPYIVICGALGFGSKYNTTLMRFLGAAVGVVQGALIGLLVIMPIDGILDIATEAIVLAEEEHPDSQNAVTIADIYHQNLDDVLSNPVLKFSDVSFGFIYDKFSTITVEGEVINAKEIADDLFELFVLYGDLGADFNFKSLTADNKKVINEIIDCFGDDHLMTAIVSGALSSVGKAASTGAIAFDAGEPMQSLYIALLEICATSDSSTVEGDLETLAKIYYLFSDEGMLQAESVTSVFASFLVSDAEGTSAFKRMVNILRENPRFENTAEVCTKVAMDLLLQNSGAGTGDGDSNVAETITNVKNGINDVVALDKNNFETEEEYKAEVNKGITNTLEENGISLSDQKIDELTDYVIENYGDKQEISDEEFLDFMTKYYDTYGKSDGVGVPDLEDPTENGGALLPGEDQNGNEEIEIPGDIEGTEE